MENYVFDLRHESNPIEQVIAPDHEARTEGGTKVFVSYKRERDPELRKMALDIHGYSCMACSFNFEQVYGTIGKGFIEVHHSVPLSQAGERKTNPETDLIVLCANCHQMVHRQEGICLSLDELKKHIRHQKQNH